MRRSLTALAIAVLFAIAAGPAAADPTPNALTPLGPATVSSVWRGASTQEGLPPQDLTAVRIAVGAGGQAGPVRLRVSSPLDPALGVELGPWTDLPADPGTYTFALPSPILWDYRSGVIAIDQQVGGHAIVVANPCMPQLGAFSDICQVVSLDVFHDIADSDPARGTANSPGERYPGQQLAVTAVTVPDLDRDHIPDDQDQTDLQVSASRRFNLVGQQVLRIVVVNAGPRTADQPLIGINSLVTADDAWFPSCVSSESFEFPGIRLPGGAVPGDSCGTKPIPVGLPRVFTVVLPAKSDRKSVTVAVRSEGADLNPADNVVKVAPAKLLELERVSVHGTLNVKVRARRRGTLRVTMKVGRRSFSRSVRVIGLGPLTVRVPFHLRGRRAHAATITIRLQTYDGAIASATKRIHL